MGLEGGAVEGRGENRWLSSVLPPLGYVSRSRRAALHDGYGFRNAKGFASKCELQPGWACADYAQASDLH